MIAGLISNVAPKGPPPPPPTDETNIKFACFFNSKLLISENFTIFHDEEILCVDGDFSICINCRTGFIVQLGVCVVGWDIISKLGLQPS